MLVQISGVRVYCFANKYVIAGMLRMYGWFSKSSVLSAPENRLHKANVCLVTCLCGRMSTWDL